MCAIAGYVGKGSRKMLKAMLDMTSHRGHDDRGIFIDHKVGLGANRLSIIDLSSRGKQPIFDRKGAVGVVLNGEIYNFQELRKQLKSKYIFMSKTDTEVLLYAYKEWGINCLKELNGMFAFVIYDKKKNLLFGARDRLGEKSLKYYLDDGIFAFASEVKGLLPALKSRPEVDPVAINYYLTLQYVPAPFTGFKKLFKLPPAHYFIFRNGELQIKKYWEISFTEKLILSEEEWVRRILEKLNESVKSRLIADVPVGVFLSGGLDSSIVVALMAQVSNKGLKTFSIGFDDPDFDESRYADLVAKLYKTNHQTFKVSNKMMSDVFTHLADYYDEPFADNSVIPTIVLSRLASKYVKVALTGDGGDENFAGYDRYNVVVFSDIYEKVPHVAKKILSSVATLTHRVVKTKFTSRVETYIRTFKLPFYKRYLYYSPFFDNETKHSLYSSQFQDAVVKHNSFEIFRPLYNPHLSKLDNALNFDIKSYLPEDLLFKIDIASMAYSLEVRAPFLNHELIELAAKIPPDLKIKFFKKKYIFKKALEDSHLLPKEIIHRRKRGFVAPIDRWLRGEFKDFVKDKLTSKKFKEANIFDPIRLEKYLQDYFRGGKISSNNIFALLSLASWIEKYL